MSNFTPALEEMQSYLPGWWQQYNETSNLYKWLSALGMATDSVSTAFDEVYTNGNLSTATAQAIYDEWAYVWGVQQEFAPPGAAETIFTAEELIEYIHLLATATGSTESLETSLLAVMKVKEATGLLFPANGEGLLFPANGEGLLFPNGVRELEIVEEPSSYHYLVRVQETVEFNREAFKRAIERQGMAHLKWTVEETKEPF
jgi:hypothetical protein